METTDIIDTWGKGELEAIRAIALLEINLKSNLAYIEKFHSYKDNPPQGNPMDFDSGWRAYNQIIDSIDEKELDNEKIRVSLEFIKQKGPCLTVDEILERYINNKIDRTTTIAFLKTKLLEVNARIEVLEASLAFAKGMNDGEVFVDLYSEKQNEDLEAEKIRASLIELENNGVDGELLEMAQKELCSRIVWNGTQADLARIFDDLDKAGLIRITSRDFSKHFILKDGEPMPLDFKESRTTNQDELSKRPEVLGIQKKIRGMKPESGE